MAETKKRTPNTVSVLVIIAAVVAFAFLLAAQYGKAPPPRTQHETVLLICKWMGRTDFNNKDSIACLLQAVKELPLIDDAKHSIQGGTFIYIKFKGNPWWEGIGDRSRGGFKRTKR